MRRFLRSSVAAVAVLAVAGVAAACGSSSGKATGGSSSGASAAHNTASAPGITPTEVKVGLIMSQTGALATTLANVDVGVKARFAVENAKGGVNGRKLTLVTADDQSSASTVLSSAQKLVQQDSVFAVTEESAVFASSYRYLQAQKVPVLSGRSIDGAEWGDPTISNMVEARGAISPTGPPPVAQAKLFKTVGATKLALLAYANSPAGAAVVAAYSKAAAAVGLQVVYVNKALPVPVTGLSTLAIAIKNSGADMVSAPLATADTFAIANATKAQGANLKANIITSVYGNSLTENATTAAAANGVTLSLPYNVTGTAGKAVEDSVHKYTSYQGVPSMGVFYGWVMADLAIEGLKKAGQNPTRETFLAALHGTTAYTAGGLGQPVDLAQAKQGTYSTSGAGNCLYAVKFQDGKFSAMQTAPFCDK